MTIIDPSGKKIGNWNIKTSIKENGYLKWICECDCGTKKSVLASNLRSGKTKSCGCNKTKHNMSNSDEYRAWYGMKNRCYNKNHDDYNNYGARGIYVCNEWINSFEKFYTDMGKRPSKNHSVERKNNDGPYSRDNCKWATRQEQGKNVRSNRNLTFNGKSQCMSSWANELNIPITTLKKRIQYGWTVERALTQKIRWGYRR